MSSLVNIQSLITFLKKQIKVDMNTEINKIKNEYQTKIDELQNEIDYLHNCDLSTILLSGTEFSPGLAGVEYKNYTIDTSKIDKRCNKYYLAVFNSGGINVAWKSFQNVSNLQEVGDVGKSIDFVQKTANLVDVGLSTSMFIFKILDINQNIGFTYRGLMGYMIFGKL